MTDRVITETNADGVVNGYRCDLLTQGNSFVPVTMPYYYDLTSPCTEASNAMQMMESLLLDSVATTYRMLPDAVSCYEPPPTQSGEPWLAAVRVQTPAAFVSAFDCEETPSDPEMCCTLVKGELTLETVGNYNLKAARDHLKVQFNEGWLTSGTTYTTNYRGSELDYSAEGGRGNLPEIPEANGVKSTPAPQQQERKITLVGGFIIAGVTTVICGALLTLYRRIRHKRQSRRTRDALAKSIDDFDGQSFDLPTIAIDVISEGSPPSKDLHSFNSSQPASYRFDLSDTMRDDVLGKFGETSQASPIPSWGPTSIAVVPPYPLEETSDSEVDSWAQTDGTVGSLEPPLDSSIDPDEAEI